MSLAECPEPSIVVDRGLALHKVLRLLVLGLGGGMFPTCHLRWFFRWLSLVGFLLKIIYYICFGNALTSHRLFFFCGDILFFFLEGICNYIFLLRRKDT